jgi:hypothetical protein
MGLFIERSALTSCSFPVKNSYHNKKFVAGTLLASPQHNNGYYYCAWCGADCVLHSAHRLSWYMLLLDYRTMQRVTAAKFACIITICNTCYR